MRGQGGNQRHTETETEREVITSANEGRADRARARGELDPMPHERKKPKDERNEERKNRGRGNARDFSTRGVPIACSIAYSMAEEESNSCNSNTVWMAKESTCSCPVPSPRHTRLTCVLVFSRGVEVGVRDGQHTTSLGARALFATLQETESPSLEESPKRSRASRTVCLIPEIYLFYHPNLNIRSFSALSKPGRLPRRVGQVRPKRSKVAPQRLARHFARPQRSNRDPIEVEAPPRLVTCENRRQRQKRPNCPVR